MASRWQRGRRLWTATNLLCPAPSHQTCAWRPFVLLSCRLRKELSRSQRFQSEPARNGRFGQQSSKSINDAPLVFEGRTLDPLRHILASASRAVSGPPARSDRRAHRVRLPGVRASRRGSKQPAAEARSDGQGSTSKPEGRVYKAICEPRIMRSRFALYKLRPTTDLIWLRDNASRTRRTPDPHKSPLDRSLDPDYSSPEDVGRHLRR